MSGKTYRTGREMLDMVLGFAKEDDRVRAVALNGSRANPLARQDILQDYDIAFLVTDVDSFVREPGWEDRFGPRLMMQTPESMGVFPPNENGWFTYLMLFEDGNRIDLALWPVEKQDVYLAGDSPVCALLDKDGLLQDLPPPTDTAYHIKPPDQKQFADCCNEFWWVATYVAKGLWRGQVLYANTHFDDVVRPMLLQMLAWRAGASNGFARNPGKCGDGLQGLLPPGEWNALLATWRVDTIDAVWEALYTAMGLFHESARFIAAKLELAYNEADEAGARRYIDRVRVLPKDAESVF